MDQLDKKAQPEFVVESLETATDIKPHVCPTCGLKVPGSVEICPQDGTRLLAELKPGMLLAGKYEFLSTVGQGGMGIIYKARQPILNKIVAIKMLHAHLMTPESLVRFQQEGKAISALSHPGVVTVHDFGLTDQDQPYMVMDFVEGKTLANVLSAQGALKLDRTINLFLEICDVMSHAHKNGVLHRDIKPSNIMLIDEGTAKESVKILDFGIAKLASSDGSGRVTRTGEAVGSPLYMSPEQALGKSTDQSSDMYAIGCVMFECLTGAPPFSGSSIMDIMLKHLNDKPPTLREASLGKHFPAAVEDIVAKLLNKDKQFRYQSADDLSLDLLAIQKGDAPKPLVLPPAYAKEDTSGRATTIKLILLCISIVAIAIVITSALVKQVFVTKASPRVAPRDDGTSLFQFVSVGQDGSSREFIIQRLKKDPRQFNGRFWPINDEDLKSVFSQPIGQNVSSLDLSDTKVTAKGLQYLSHLPLINLELSNLPIADFSPLAKTRLESLSIQESMADDGSMKTISQIPFLTKLDLKGTSVKDAGFKLLSKCTKLSRVNITGTAITADGIKALRKSLPLVEIYDDNLARNGVEMRQRSERLIASGKFAKAAALDKKICEYTSLYMPPTDLHYIKSHFLAAQHLRQAGKPKEAIAYAERATAEAESIRGPEQHVVLGAFSELGTTQLLLGETEAARKTFERAVRVAATTSRNDTERRRHLADYHHKLGDIAVGQNRFADATRHLNEALHLYEGMKEPSTHMIYESGMVHYQLGENLRRQKMFESCLVEYHKALKIFDKLAMSGSRETAATLMHVGEALSSLNRIDEAVVYFKKSQNIFEDLKMAGEADYVKRNLAVMGH